MLAHFNADKSDGILGDLDGDKELDVEDIELLTDAIRQGTAPNGYDLNGDSAVDVQDHTTWVVELKQTWFGDANLDGEFNSSDFVNVFQAGKFETNTPASWSEGDWDGDGIFGSGDFVKAFQDGGFELGQRSAAQAVPEPSALVLMLLAIGCLLGSRRKQVFR